MQRESNVQTLNWADKTMSVMRMRQMEACEKRLGDCPDFGLFDGCDDQKIEEIWAHSFYGQRRFGAERLHTTEETKRMILAQLPREAALLSVQEHMLVERMLVFDGEADLMDSEEAAAAEGLIERMWCTLRKEGERLILFLPEALRIPLTIAFSDEQHQEVRERVFRFDATIRGLLYIGGFLHYEEPLHHLLTDVVQGDSQEDRMLAMRFLKTSFDYTYGERSEMLLLHPGLAEPERLLAAMRKHAEFTFAMSEETMAGAISGILPEEIPSTDMMIGLLQGAVRPEITEEEAAEDLRMLAKQGVTLREMNEVLGSLLTVLPTSDMYFGVKLIYQQTPRWTYMKSAVMN